VSELADHRIASLRETRVCTRYPRHLGKNARRDDHGELNKLPVIEIATDRGATGWGGVPRGYEAGADEAWLSGTRLSELIDPDIGVIAPRAMGLDTALHDLAGRILGIPVYRMLACEGPLSLPCYDGAIYMNDVPRKGELDPPEIILENCRQDFGLGYRAFKLKIGRGHQWVAPAVGLARDIKVTRLVREQFPDCRIFVDANNGYDEAGFLEYFDAVADCGLHWIEEPFEIDGDNLRRLRERLDEKSPDTLIADGEGVRPGAERPLIELARQGIVNVVMFDVLGYGFTNWRRLLPALADAKVMVSPHSWGSQVKTNYAAHLAGGPCPVPTLEGVPGRIEGADASGYRLEDGVLHVPDAPGFGMTLAAADCAVD